MSRRRCASGRRRLHRRMIERASCVVATLALDDEQKQDSLARRSWDAGQGVAIRVDDGAILSGDPDQARSVTERRIRSRLVYRTVLQEPIRVRVT
jgi:hypothetical protein